VNLPPRTLKSHAPSVAFPAWLLGHDPARQIICASYGQELADKHARDSRTLISSQFYRQLFPRTVLSPDKQAVSDFQTTRQGFRMATSVGGVLTGRGGDFLILDDILKPDDALSETRRKAANEWYLNTLLSRLNSKKDGVIILVMQRLHQEDLVGEVIEREQWKVVSLPAIAKEDECYPYIRMTVPLRFERKAGEALHPERDPLETLQKIRFAIGEYNFESQYQQSPMPLDGNMIKREWLRYYESLPQDPTYTLQSWDTANKSGELNDFSVCTTWWLVGREFYLIDVFRKRLTFPQLKQAVIDRYQKYQPYKILIEDKSSGTSLIQELQASGILGVEAYKPLPGSDKSMRFAAQSIKFEGGRVYLPSQASWVDEYVREITGFPGAKHDDQVDSTSQALDHLGTMANDFAVWDALGRGLSVRAYETW
jgi:predicted phage terminase large subunit-like protein